VAAFGTEQPTVAKYDEALELPEKVCAGAVSCALPACDCKRRTPAPAVVCMHDLAHGGMHT
jgi:hypothetical protein